jgi:hypothetical protein
MARKEKAGSLKEVFGGHSRSTLIFSRVLHCLRPPSHLHVGSTIFIHRKWPAGENNALEWCCSENRDIDEARVELAVHIQLADAAGNQMRVLRPKVKDGNLVMGTLVCIFSGHGGEISAASAGGVRMADCGRRNAGRRGETGEERISQRMGFGGGPIKSSPRPHTPPALRRRALPVRTVAVCRVLG